MQKWAFDVDSSKPAFIPVTIQPGQRRPTKGFSMRSGKSKQPPTNASFVLSVLKHQTFSRIFGSKKIQFANRMKVEKRFLVFCSMRFMNEEILHRLAS
jgi:hypothetical protein